MVDAGHLTIIVCSMNVLGLSIYNPFSLFYVESSEISLIHGAEEKVLMLLYTLSFIFNMCYSCIGPMCT